MPATLWACFRAGGVSPRPFRRPANPLHPSEASRVVLPIESHFLRSRGARDIFLGARGWGIIAFVRRLTPWCKRIYEVFDKYNVRFCVDRENSWEKNIEIYFSFIGCGPINSNYSLNTNVINKARIMRNVCWNICYKIHWKFIEKLINELFSWRKKFSWGSRVKYVLPIKE